MPTSFASSSIALVCPSRENWWDSLLTFKFYSCWLAKSTTNAIVEKAAFLLFLLSMCYLCAIDWCYFKFLYILVIAITVTLCQVSVTTSHRQLFCCRSLCLYSKCCCCCCSVQLQLDLNFRPRQLRSHSYIMYDMYYYMKQPVSQPASQSTCCTHKVSKEELEKG